MQNKGMNFHDHSLSPFKILVVDGYLNTADLLARSIARFDAGVEAVSATSAHQALECIQDGIPDILVASMDLPDMTGLELIEKLQETPTGSRVVSFLITNSHVPGMKIEARRLRVRQVLYKPISPQKVCELVRQALQEMDQREADQELETRKGSFKILIADDEPAHVTLLSRYLEGEGYVYITAQDGLEALERIDTEEPDLILLDANMPNKDGLTVLQELRANPATQHIPVIVLSAAWISATEIHNGLNLVPENFLTKPIDRRELLTRIRKKLKETLKLEYERIPE
jgi:CheY-like chemotaxis protein